VRIQWVVAAPVGLGLQDDLRDPRPDHAPALVHSHSGLVTVPLIGDNGG
jgi:hypothetical protein